MRKQLALLMCLGVVISHSNVQALTAGARFKFSLMAMAAAFGGTYYHQNKKENPFPLPWAREGNGSLKYRDKLAPAAIPGGIAGLAFLWMSSYFSPEYRHQWAMRKRDDLKKKILFNYGITSKNLKEMSIASGAESRGMPLVTLFLQLSDIDRTLSKVIAELEIALQDVSDSSPLSLQVSDLLDDLHKDRLRIRQSEHAVKNSNPASWEEQWRLYNQNKMKQREIAAMHEIAARPQVHYGFNYHV